MSGLGDNLKISKTFDQLSTFQFNSYIYMVVSLSNFTYSVCNHCMAMYDDNSDDVVDNSDDSTATATVTIRTIIISTTASITTYATTISNTVVTTFLILCL